MPKNDRKKIKFSELRYRRLFETAQDAIIILDGETGKIHDANPFLLDMLGYKLDDLIGKELWNIGLFKNIKEAKKLFKELKFKKYIRYEHLPLQNKKKKIFEVEFVCNLYMVGDKKVIQCNIRDISVRVQAAKLLAEHSESIEQLNKVMVGREIKMVELKKEIKRLNKINKELKKNIDLVE